MYDIAIQATAVVIVCLAIYLVVYKIYPSAGNEDLVPKIASLREKKNQMMPDAVQRKILGSGGCTVMGFFYVRQGDRTLAHHPADHYIPLLQVENNWSFEIASSPREKEAYQARLRIHTQDAGQLQTEVIPLPALPRQKWVWVAILREGRRFDVIYDKEIVASQRMKYYPVLLTSPLSTGNNGLDGSVVHLLANDRRLSPVEVERERLARSDTAGMPISAKWNPFHKPDLPTMPSLKLTTACPPGLPCDPITSPPTRSLYEWKTPYA